MSKEHLSSKYKIELKVKIVGDYWRCRKRRRDLKYQAHISLKRPLQRIPHTEERVFKSLSNSLSVHPWTNNNSKIATQILIQI